MIFKYVNGNGETFQLSNTGDYFILSWWGFGDLPVEHKTSKAPYQDGETLIDTYYGKRDFGISFTIVGNSRQQIFDRRLTVSKHFNAKLGIGYFEWTQSNGSTIYRIDCIPSKVTFADGNGQGASWQDVIIEFMAPNPFWYNPTVINSILVGFSGGLSFPFSFPISFGTVTSQITVNNSGDVDTPVVLSFVGEIEDPVLENVTTGESMTISKNIPSGSTLIITTQFGNKTVQIFDGVSYTNAFEYVDPSSVFWQLIPGNNIIKYSVSYEGSGSYCSLQYYNRFSGV